MNFKTSHQLIVDRNFLEPENTTLETCNNSLTKAVNPGRALYTLLN